MQTAQPRRTMFAGRDAKSGPHSLEAEQMVLGSLLVDTTAWDRIGALCANDFAVATNAAIFAAARVGWLAGDVADTVLVSQRLRDDGNLDRVGGLQHLNELVHAVQVFTTSNLERYAAIVSNRALLRGLMAAAASINDLARDPTLQPDEAIESALGIIGALADGKHQSGLEAFADVVVHAADCAIHGNRILYRDMHPVKALEEKFGALEPGQMMVLAGRPGMGKTAAGLQAALRAASAGHHTAFFELEMTGIALASRALANWGGIPLEAIRYGDCSRFASALRATRDRLSALPIQLNTTPALHVDALRAQCRAISRRKPLRLIVVDHLTLMRGEGRDKREQVGYISNVLKVIAKENDAVVMALVQLNRQSETRPNKRPELSDLRESGEIEQDADGVVMLYRDAYYNQTSLDQDIVELIIRKNREGTVGTALCRAVLEESRFDDLPHDFRLQRNEPSRRSQLREPAGGF